ncbi:hypothetical protein LC55x_0664 [Lysobacter capsici]|nr:hypothetical protein LC55x_0664 [Lysobacter capsici]
MVAGMRLRAVRRERARALARVDHASMDVRMGWRAVARCE